MMMMMVRDCGFNMREDGSLKTLGDNGVNATLL